MFLIPKLGKRQKKPPKPIRRSRKAIAAKSVFKAHGENAFKSYRRRYTDAQVMAKAREYQLERKRDMPAAQIAFNRMLDSLGVLYESEAIFLNGDRFILVDVYVKGAKIVFEIDGQSHQSQRRYDVGRDAWLFRVHGIRTIRVENLHVFRRGQSVREGVIKTLGLY